MGSFSIWHWLIVLISFAPAIVGIAVMGWQHTVLVKHEQSGLQKNGYVGYSLTYFFFGLGCRFSSLERKPWLLGHYLLL